MAKLSSKAAANRWFCSGYRAEMMESFIQKGDTYVRLLIWHVDRFRAEPTERGRSKVADVEPRAVAVEDALVVFAAAEKQDEAEPDAVAERATTAIEEAARQLGARTVVLHSFAHLFVELSAPAIARAILNTMEQRLAADGYAVSQSAFGWFNRLELHAKGHPLSRIARQV
ncbi:MAG TPA: threonyl-tRNA synthetase editing domain-containing protein [Ktedonobacterales bacterium]|nr:threonyl-tRNA synthetase editing domain-containing protein [Ktedonobacterales bacterium]